MTNDPNDSFGYDDSNDSNESNDCIFSFFRLIVMTALMNSIVPIQMETNTLKPQFYLNLMPPTVYGGYLIIVQSPVLYTVGL